MINFVFCNYMFYFFKFIRKLENKANKKTHLLPSKHDEFGNWMVTGHVGKSWKPKSQVYFFPSAFYRSFDTCVA